MGKGQQRGVQFNNGDGVSGALHGRWSPRERIRLLPIILIFFDYLSNSARQVLQ
jgi:hypothetical protein